VRGCPQWSSKKLRSEGEMAQVRNRREGMMGRKGGRHHSSRTSVEYKHQFQRAVSWFLDEALAHLQTAKLPKACALHCAPHCAPGQYEFKGAPVKLDRRLSDCQGTLVWNLARAACVSNIDGHVLGL
jgi:hypothetical protein